MGSGLVLWVVGTLEASQHQGLFFGGFPQLPNTMLVTPETLGAGVWPQMYPSGKMAKALTVDFRNSRAS